MEQEIGIIAYYAVIKIKSTLLLVSIVECRKMPYLEKRHPKGWEKANSWYETIESVSETHNRIRFILKVNSIAGEIVAYVTDSFIREKWDEDVEPPPIPTSEEIDVKKKLIEKLHKDGWKDTVSVSGRLTETQYWRRIK
jgi:hypothetical protein